MQGKFWGPALLSCIQYDLKRTVDQKAVNKFKLTSVQYQAMRFKFQKALQDTTCPLPRMMRKACSSPECRSRDMIMSISRKLACEQRQYSTER